MAKTPERKPKLNEPACVAKLSSIEDALYVIGGKWKLRVIVALRDGESKRFNELQRTIKGISARVLSNELKELEMNGFVKRIVRTDQYPVVVEYLPTDYSATLSDIIRTLAEWGHKHKKKITAKG